MTDIDKSRKTNLAEQRKLVQYSTGFGLSIITTLLAYTFTAHHIFTGWTLAYVVVLLALAQVAVQLLFFLHIGHESEPRWNLLALDFTLLIVVIIVFGTLWIMDHLNYHSQHSSPEEINNFLVQDEGYQRQ